MTVISIRLPEELFQEIKHKSRALHISNTDYIRKAIEHMNEEVSMMERKNQLIHASRQVRKESLNIS